MYVDKPDTLQHCSILRQTHSRTRTEAYILMYTLRTYIHIYITYIRTHIYMRGYMHASVYTHIHICTHINT